METGVETGVVEITIADSTEKGLKGVLVLWSVTCQRASRESLSDAPRSGEAAIPTSHNLLVCLGRSEDLRYYAEKYGGVKDVYLPKDYYTG